MGWNAGVDYVQENGWYRPKPSSGGGASYTFAGITDTTTVAPTAGGWTTSFNIGPANAGRLIVVGLQIQNGPALTAMQANSVSLTQLGTTGNGYLYYGTVASGSGAVNFFVNCTNMQFLAGNIAVWYATGLGSNTPVGSLAVSATSGNLSANANVGDSIFAFLCGTGASASWAGSSQAPSNTHQDTTIGGGFNAFTADWVSTVSGTFTVAESGISGEALLAGNWR